MKTYHHKQGMGLIEVIVGVGLIATALIGVVAGFSALVQVSLSQTAQVKAIYLLEEGSEALRSVRDTSWETFAGLNIGTPYFLNWNGSLWEASTTPVVIDGFYRTAVLSPVYRDSNEDIAPSGTVDERARHGVITVAWQHRGATSTKTMEVYLFDIFSD